MTRKVLLYYKSLPEDPVDQLYQLKKSMPMEGLVGKKLFPGSLLWEGKDECENVVYVGSGSLGGFLQSQHKIKRS